MGDRPSWATKDGTRPTRPAWGHFPAPPVLERPRAGRVDSVNIQKGARAASVGADVRWENAHDPYTYIHTHALLIVARRPIHTLLGSALAPLLGRTSPLAPPRGSDPSGLSPLAQGPRPPRGEPSRNRRGSAAPPPPRAWIWSRRRGGQPSCGAHALPCGAAGGCQGCRRRDGTTRSHLGGAPAGIPPVGCVEVGGRFPPPLANRDSGGGGALLIRARPPLTGARGCACRQSRRRPPNQSSTRLRRLPEGAPRESGGRPTRPVIGEGGRVLAGSGLAGGRGSRIRQLAPPPPGRVAARCFRPAPLAGRSRNRRVSSVSTGTCRSLADGGRARSGWGGWAWVLGRRADRHTRSGTLAGCCDSAAVSAVPCLLAPPRQLRPAVLARVEEGGEPEGTPVAGSFLCIRASFHPQTPSPSAPLSSWIARMCTSCDDRVRDPGCARSPLSPCPERTAAAAVCGCAVPTARRPPRPRLFH